MTDIRDLRHDVIVLETKLAESRNKLHAAMIAAHPIQPGAFIVHPRGGRAQVSGLYIRDDQVRVAIEGIDAGHWGFVIDELEAWDVWKPEGAA